MDRFFDEAARILASPIGRRQAFKLLGGVLVAGIWGTRASAQTCNPACPTGFKCCDTRGQGGNFCIPENFICCKNKGCNPENEICCGNLQCCGPHLCQNGTRCKASK
jgi:hypothetical protein